MKSNICFALFLSSLMACGGSGKEDTSVAIDPLTNAITSMKFISEGLYFSIDDSVYYIEGDDFNHMYCSGYNPDNIGIAQAPKGLSLNTLPNGNLFTTDGSIIDKGLTIKEYNYDGVVQESQYIHASIFSPMIVEGKYWDGANYSLDGENWHVLISDNKAIRSDARYLWDIQFIKDEHHAVGLFDTATQGNFLAVYTQNQWQEVISDTDVKRLLYTNNKLLGFDRETVKVIDTETGVTLSEFKLNNMRYISTLKNNLVYTDGYENYQFNLDTYEHKRIDIPDEIGLITSIQEYKDVIYYGTSTGIWRYQNKDYLQIYKIDDNSNITCYIKSS